MTRGEVCTEAADISIQTRPPQQRYIARDPGYVVTSIGPFCFPAEFYLTIQPHLGPGDGPELYFSHEKRDLALFPYLLRNTLRGKEISNLARIYRRIFISILSRRNGIFISRYPFASSTCFHSESRLIYHSLSRLAITWNNVTIIGDALGEKCRTASVDVVTRDALKFKSGLGLGQIARIHIHTYTHSYVDTRTRTTSSLDGRIHSLAEKRNENLTYKSSRLSSRDSNVPAARELALRREAEYIRKTIRRAAYRSEIVPEL